MELTEQEYTTLYQKIVSDVQKGLATDDEASKAIGEIAANEPSQQAEQRVDLAFGPAPVFRGEGKQRQELDARFAGSLNRFADSLHALVVADRARKTALLCPTAVAIHDDGNMLRND